MSPESESGLRISPRPNNFPLAQGKSVKSWKFQAPFAKFESNIRIFLQYLRIPLA